MARANARFRWLNVSTAESAVSSPVNFCRNGFLHRIGQLSEAIGVLALRPERTAVSRMVRIRVELGYTNSRPVSAPIENRAG
jgi:hypothetical protein